jgi:calcium permeable stress-gated cation channel
MLGRFEGIPQKKGVELSLMDRYFMFQVIVCGSFVSSLTKSLTIQQNGFLVITFSSGLIASLPFLVNNPSSVPSLLAQNLPKSSTFFLTWVPSS